MICSLQAIPSRCNVFQKSGHSGCAKNGAIVHRTPYGFILTHLVEPVNKQFNGFSVLHKTVEIILDTLLLESGKHCGKRKKRNRMVPACPLDAIRFHGLSKDNPTSVGIRFVRIFSNTNGE